MRRRVPIWNWLLTRGFCGLHVVTAARSPWQNPFVERLIGSIRRECLDHVIVWNASSLRRVLQNYFEYYERSRMHLALNKHAPVSRPVEDQRTAALWKLPKSGDSIVDTSAAPPRSPSEKSCSLRNQTAGVDLICSKLTRE